MTAWDDHIADRGARTNTLVDLYAWDREAAEERVLRYAIWPFATGANDYPAHTRWSALLDSEITYDGGDVPIGTVAGFLDPRNRGSLVLGNNAGDLDSLFAPGPLDFMGRKCVVRQGGYTPTTGHQMTLDEYREVDGSPFRMGQPVLQPDTVTVPIFDRGRDFHSRLAARTFRGCGDCIDLPHGSHVVLTQPPKLQIVDDLTVEMWLWPGDLATTGHLLSWRSQATSWPFAMFVGTDAKINFDRSGWSGPVVSLDTLDLKRWHHVAVACLGTTVTMHLHTPSTGADIKYSFERPGVVPVGDGVLSLGVFFDGFLQQVRCWSRARTDGEVRKWRKRPLTAHQVSDADLAAYWTLDGDLADSSGNDNNGSEFGAIEYLAGLEGDADSQGVTVPDPWGVPRNVTPYLVHPQSQTYCVAAAGIEGIPRVNDNGADVTLGVAYLDIRSFLQGSTLPGHYDIAIDGPDGSYFRLGSGTDGVVTCDLEGYPQAGRTASSIVQHAITTRGYVPLMLARLDAPAWQQLDAAAPGDLEFWAPPDNELSLVDLVREVLETVGASAWWDDNLLTVARFEGPAPAASRRLTQQHIGSVEVLRPDPHAWRWRLGFRRNHTVMSQSSIAGSVRETPYALFLDREYRWATAEDDEVRSRYRSAATIQVLETHYVQRADAEAEAERRLQLFSGPSQGLLISVTGAAHDVRRFDTIEVALLERDASGQGMVQRLGLGAGERFIVLGTGLRDSSEGAARTLTLWRTTNQQGGQ